MFTSGTHSSVKSLHPNPSSSLRVLIATVAFGMGVNLPDVHYVIHCGPPNDMWFPGGEVVSTSGEHIW